MNNSENSRAITVANLRRSPIARLRLIALLEGITLITLLFIAVPLKHIFDQPGLVTLLGPVHGIAFLIYLFALVETVSEGGFTMREVIRSLLAALVPFGPFINDRFLANQQMTQQECE